VYLGCPRFDAKQYHIADGRFDGCFECLLEPLGAGPFYFFLDKKVTKNQVSR
jgi:hypothetical protein